MSFIDRILDARNARQRNYRAEQANRVAQEIRQNFRLSPLCSDYENLFAQVRPLINEMKMVRPFAVNEKGERIKNPNKTTELNLLDYPNDEMGWAEFADLMFATWLTKDQLFIHVHKDKRDKVIGYKAESGLSRDALVAKARARLEQYDLSAVIANDIDSAGKTSASSYTAQRMFQPRPSTP